MFNRVLVCLSLFLLLAPAAIAEYPNPPKILIDAVQEAAITIIEEESADQLRGAVPDLTALVLADLLARDYGLTEIASYNYFSEMKRTDKQIGAAGNANGSTTVVEAVSFPRVLSLAIERGAIQQKTNGTTATLSTTPYFSLVAFKADTAERYRKVGWLDRLGLSATFNVDDGASDFEDLRRYRNYRYVESSLFVFNHFGVDGRFGATGAVRWAVPHRTTTSDKEIPIDRRAVSRTLARDGDREECACAAHSRKAGWGGRPMS